MAWSASSALRNTQSVALTVIHIECRGFKASVPGGPVEITRMTIAGMTLWGRMADLAALIEAARDRGFDIQPSVEPYTQGNHDLAMMIRSWAHEWGRNSLLSGLKDLAIRQTTVDAIIKL